MKRYAAALALALLAGCAGTGEFFREAGPPPPAEPRTLQDLSWRELWSGVVFRGRKVGFSHLSIAPAADAPGFWDIETESAIRLRFLGVDKRISLRARDRVRDDLTLERFHYDYELDGSRLSVDGERAGGALVVRTENEGMRREQRLPMTRPAIPASALALLPVLRGLRLGSAASATVFVGEAQSLATAEQHVLAYQRSSLFDGAAYRVDTTLLGLQTETWIDGDGRPVFETAMNGAMITALEDARRARADLVEASLNKDESLLDFSLLRAPPIAAPRRAAALSITLEGVPRTLSAPSGGGQRCTREGPLLACRIDRRAPGEPGEAREAARYLRATLAAPSNERRFIDLARSITEDADGAAAKIDRLLAWIDTHIAKQAVDAFSASDVLRERRAECQGHAYLFAALARAAGLPTRVVNGLVYAPEYGGFLYHTWNEVWIAQEGWRPVDATFGQARADATHVALAVGEGAAELAPLAAVVGRVRIEALGAVAHW